jgi:uncharacterized membrane protein YidH (DUF202 family)
MKTNEPSASIGEEKKATEYLANERTFLAWIRTSIAIISLGFVVAKFTVWLRELAIRFDPQASTGGTGASLPIGVGMMAVGGIFAALAARRYHLVNRTPFLEIPRAYPAISIRRGLASSALGSVRVSTPWLSRAFTPSRFTRRSRSSTNR